MSPNYYYFYYAIKAAHIYNQQKAKLKYKSNEQTLRCIGLKHHEQANEDHTAFLTPV